MTLKTGKVSIGTQGLVESFGMAAYKVFSEQILKRTFVGDATVKSGLIKLGLGLGTGLLIPSGTLGSPIRRMVSSGHIVDGMEDLVYGSGAAGLLGGGSPRGAPAMLSGQPAAESALLAVI